jgi:hypothetical protein
VRWQDADGSDLWVTPDETREQVIGFYQHAWGHADATIKALTIDAPGHVPWWSRPEVKLFIVMVHVPQETARHAGQADILREQLDGMTGVAAEYEEQMSLLLPGPGSPGDRHDRGGGCRRLRGLGGGPDLVGQGTARPLLTSC